MMQVEVRGAAARIDALFRFDKAAWRDLQRGVKRATQAVTKHAEARVPPMGIIPMGGGPGWGPWNHFGRDLSYRRSAFRFKTSFQSRSRKGFRQIQGRAILDVSDASVAIFTLAGFVPGENKKTRYRRSSRNFKRTINRQTGTISGAKGRGMWPRLLTPAYHAEGPKAAQTIGQLVQAAVTQANN